MKAGQEEIKGPGARITFVGHATVLIELAGTRLVTDPVLRDRILHIRRTGASPESGLTRGVDGILISHLHHDHLDAASLRRFAGRPEIVIPRGACLLYTSDAADE